MTTEASPAVQTVALEEWRVTFVMTAGKLRRPFVFPIPASSYQAALTAAYELARVVHDATDGVWTPSDEFSVEVTS